MREPRGAGQCQSLGEDGKTVWNKVGKRIFDNETLPAVGSFADHVYDSSLKGDLESIAAHWEISLPEEIAAIVFSGQVFDENLSIQGYEFPSKTKFVDCSFCGLDAGDAKFTKGVSFSGCDFGGSVKFDGAVFGKFSEFQGNTFGEEFSAVLARFKGGVDFSGRTFEGPASFQKATFTEGAAVFEGATFVKIADFQDCRFEQHAKFARATFGSEARFRMSYFGDVTEFNKAVFRGAAYFDGDSSEKLNFGMTRFDNATFERAPHFFERQLFEDTRWDGVVWPRRPQNKTDAAEAVHCYDRLSLIVATQKKYDDEHLFYRLSTEAKEVRDGLALGSLLSRAYGCCFRYGWGMERAFFWWGLHILLLKRRAFNLTHIRLHGSSSSIRLV